MSIALLPLPSFLLGIFCDALLQEEVPKEEKAEGDEDKIEEVKDDDEPKEKKKKKVGTKLDLEFIRLPACAPQLLAILWGNATNIMV